MVIGARYIPGFSTTAVIAVALSTMSTRKFLVLNAIGAFVWALALGVLGFALGQAVERFLGEIERYEKPVAVGLLVAALIWIVWHHVQAFRSAIGTPA